MKISKITLILVMTKICFNSDIENYTYKKGTVCGNKPTNSYEHLLPVQASLNLIL